VWVLEIWKIPKMFWIGVLEFWKEIVEAKSKILGEAAVSEVRNPARVQAENVVIKLRGYD
jgi:hypothetical protein